MLITPLLWSLCSVVATQGKACPIGETFRDVPNRSVVAGLEDAVLYASDSEALEARLPEILGATWRSSGKNRKLERTQDQERRLGTDDAAVITATLAEGLQPSISLRSLPFDVTLARRLAADLDRPVVAGDRSYGPRGVADTLLLHLLADLAPRLGTELKTNLWATYASSPTLAERLLPANSSARLVAYTAIEQEVARMYAQGGTGRLYEWDYARIVAPGLTSPSPVARANLSLVRSEVGISVYLTLYRPDGSTRTSVGFNLPTAEVSVKPFSFEGSSDSIDVTLSDADLEAAFLSREPLDVVVTPALNALAKRMGRPVVVALPDTTALSFAKTPPVTLGAVVRMIEAQGIEFSLEDDALIGKPVDLARFMRANMSRPALRRYIATMLGEGADWMRAWSRLYAETKCMTALAHHFRETILPAEGRPAATLEMPGIGFQLLGHLSDDEWIALHNGFTVRLGSDSTRRATADTFLHQMDRAPGSERVPDVALMRTWSFPNGIPQEATLSMISASELMVKTARTSPDFWPIQMFVGNMFIAEDTVPAMEKELAKYGDDKIEFGTRSKQIFTLTPGEGLVQQCNQPDVKVRSLGPAVKFGQVSKDLQEEIYKEVRVTASLRRKDGANASPP